MSASSKKKLRNAQEAGKLTERQIAEAAEAKKIKLYTTAFVVTLAAILIIAVVIGTTQFISTSGIREKNTVAMTINDTELNNAELNYFYIDSVNNFYSQNGSYAALLGLDVSKPLNEQVIDETTGDTWADNFVSTAKENAKAVYAIWEKAVAAGHTLTEEEQQNMESAMESLDFYGVLYGYSDAKGWLKAMYGQGATLDSYRSYLEKTMLAQSYQDAYQASLTYDDAALRSAEAENFNKYSSYAYNYYYVNASSFLEDSANATDEQKAAAVKEAEETAKTLSADTITSADALDAAIQALPMHAENATVASTRFDAQLYTSITSTMVDWLTDSSRKEGDITYLANTVTDAEGKETVNGYYVVRFESVTDNTMLLKNVRHILVSAETEEEKADAKATAEELLKEWKAGEATEASFAGIAAEKTADTASAAEGGLYENVYPGQMVAAFNDWCFDDSRKAGDTGIVETEYGYHIMYFVSNADINYRDYQITNELRTADVNAWYSEIVDAATITDGEVKYLAMDLVLSN